MSKGIIVSQWFLMLILLVYVCIYASLAAKYERLYIEQQKTTIHYQEMVIKWQEKYKEQVKESIEFLESLEIHDRRGDVDITVNR